MNDPDKLAKFLSAIDRGSKVIAHPETATAIRPHIGVEIEENKFIPIGEVYAVDFSRYSIPAEFLKDDNFNFGSARADDANFRAMIDRSL